MTLHTEPASRTIDSARTDAGPLRPAPQRGRRRGDPDPEGGQGLARALGWLSQALGLAALARPRALARMAGVREDRRNDLVLRLAGAREGLTGGGAPARSRPTRWGCAPGGRGATDPAP